MLNRLLSILIRLYQITLSPYLGRNCRYLPTCSEYALEALELHQLHRAAKLIFRRLVRCQPWGGHGYDPVPKPKG